MGTGCRRQRTPRQGHQSVAASCTRPIHLNCIEREMLLLSPLMNVNLIKGPFACQSRSEGEIEGTASGGKRCLHRIERNNSVKDDIAMVSKTVWSFTTECSNAPLRYPISPCNCLVAYSAPACHWATKTNKTHWSTYMNINATMKDEVINRNALKQWEKQGTWHKRGKKCARHE